MKRALLLLPLGCAISACGTMPPPAVGPTATLPTPDMGQEAYETEADPIYRLRPADMISVLVYREPELSVESVPVGLDGTIVFPVIGQIMVQGTTPGELSSIIADRLRVAGLKRPEVAVNLSDAASHRVTVEGGVDDPGVFEFEPGDRLSSAIALANGPTRIANLKQVAIFRRGGGGMMVAKFDYRAVSQGTMIDPVLEPGDRVVVGTSGLSQFWQDLLRALPAFGLFTNVNW